jgi:TRAP-type C4-dicarboxylate transport system permease small subunit
VLGHLERACFLLARLLATLGLLVLIVFAAMTLADGLLRSLAGSPIEIVRDLGGLVVAVSVACCFPLAFLERTHITIKFAGTFFNARVGQALDAAAAVIVTVVAALMAWQLWLYADKALRANDTTLMLEIGIAPYWYAVAVMLACAAAVQAFVAISAVLACFEAPPAPPPAGPLNEGHGDPSGGEIRGMSAR